MFTKMGTLTMMHAHVFSESRSWHFRFILLFVLNLIIGNSLIYVIDYRLDILKPGFYTSFPLILLITLLLLLVSLFTSILISNSLFIGSLNYLVITYAYPFLIIERISYLYTLFCLAILITGILLIMWIRPRKVSLGLPLSMPAGISHELFSPFHIDRVLKNTALYLASYVISFSTISLLSMMYPWFIRGKEDISSLIILHITMLVLGLVFSVFMNKSDKTILLTGLIAGSGLVNIVPLLFTLCMRETLSSELRSEKISHENKEGIYLGVARARLRYGYPSNLYKGLNQHWLRENHLGETWYWSSVVEPIYVILDKLNTPHIVIVGASGSGKTLFAKHLVRESKRAYGYRTMIIDPHGEYRDMAKYIDNLLIINAAEEGINPLALGKSSPRERALQLSHTIATLFKLGFIQRKLLEELIMDTYRAYNIHQEDPSTWSNQPPTLSDLLNMCRKKSDENADYQRILPYLDLLHESMGGIRWFSPDLLFINDVVVDLSGLSSDFARALYVEALLYMVVNKMYLSKGGAIPVQIVIDEARSIMPRELGMELLSRLFMESRKFGFSMVIISQEITRIPKPLINNAGLRVFFILNEPESIELAAKIIAGGYAREKILPITAMLRSLEQHNFILHVTGVDDIYVVENKPAS
ncbi:MAG: ATP-binding protein [Desulfurococcaceae archaeon]